MSRRGDAPLSFDDTPPPGVPAVPAARVDTPAFGATEVVTASGMPAVSAADVVVGDADEHEAPTRMMALPTGAQPVLGLVRSEERPPAGLPSVEAPRTEPGLPLVKSTPAAKVAPPPPPPPAPPKPAPRAGVRAAAAEQRQGLPPLPFHTSAVPDPPKRPLPRAARIAIGAGAALLVLIVIGNLRGKPKEVPQLKLDRDVAVHEEDLRKRREVTPTDFTHLGRTSRPSGPVAVAVAPTGPVAVTGAPAEASEAVSAQELEARRERRGEDPADLRGLKPRGAAPAAPGVRSDELVGHSKRRQPRQLYMDLGPSADPSGGEEKGQESGDRVLVSAGASLNAALETPIHLTGGGATSVVALVVDGPQKGARLLGTASYSSGRVTVHFRSFITRDGEELDIRGEARGEDGGFGLPVEVAAGDDDQEESAEASVAKDTGTEVVASALGGLGGSVVRDYSRSKRQRMSRGRKEQPIDIDKGESVSVFVQSAVTMHYAKQARP